MKILVFGQIRDNEVEENLLGVLNKISSVFANSEIYAALPAGKIDDKWIDVMVTYWFEDENSPLWNDEIGQKLLELAPANTVNCLCRTYLNKIKGLPEEESPAFQLLLRNDAPWDNDLTKLIISRLQEWVAITKVMDWNALHYKQFLDMAALRSSPSLFTFLEKGWRTTAPLWYNWEKLVSEMLNTVLFRREMILELEAL